MVLNCPDVSPKRVSRSMRIARRRRILAAGTLAAGIITAMLLFLSLNMEIETEHVQASDLVPDVPHRESTREIVPIEEVVTVEEIILTPRISDEDRELLARCVMAEAGNQSELGQRLVCAVILNRVEDPDYPDSIAGVITQPGQFATWPTAMYNYIPTEMVYESVDKELENRTDRRVLAFRTGHYHNFYQPLFKEGAHYFSGK